MRSLSVLHDRAKFGRRRVHRHASRDRGTAVAAIVVEVTDNKMLPSEERKAAQIAHARDLSPGAKLIKLADKIRNLNSLRLSPPVEWTTERRLAYVEWRRKVVAGLRGADTMLEKVFDETAEAAGRVHQGPPASRVTDRGKYRAVQE
jgi:GTP diphosphokinase / guanosine-3',5'-bis(diphosphate) 3'-diphosphatase